MTIDRQTSRGLAVVTAGVSRVGLAISRRLAQDGFAVLATFRRQRQAAEQLEQWAAEHDVICRTLACDLTDADQRAALTQHIQQASPPITLLVNNAACYQPSPLEQIVESDMTATLSINAMVPVLLARALAPMLGNANPGQVINITDTMSPDRPRVDYLAYGMSKAALHHATLVLAKAWAPQLRVNAVAPGIVAWSGRESESLRQSLIDRIPQGRIGKPEDVADAVAWLATGSSHVTGVVLPVDGGRRLD